MSNVHYPSAEKEEMLIHETILSNKLIKRIMDEIDNGDVDGYEK